MMTRPSLLIFAIWINLFALILINGYALNLVGLPANASVILALILAEFIALARWLHISRWHIQGDPLELAGFLLVIVGTWLYFFYASLPTLLPPSYSGDAANHLAYADEIFSTGQIFANYPGGASLITATLAHWMGWLPIRLMHPLASLWIALTAGGMYALACGLLPRNHMSETVALLAIVWLVLSSNYFTGLLIGANYFYPQVAGQLFLIAFIVFLNEYLASRQAFWLFSTSLCLIAISLSFQILLALATGLVAIAFLNEWRKGTKHVLNVLLIVFGPLAVWTLAILLTGGKYFPNLGKLQEFGAVLDPSIEALGGWFLLLPAFGVILLRRAGSRGLIVGAFLALCALQTLAVFLLRAFGLASDYWFSKTFYVWIYPLALGGVLPIARVVEWLNKRLDQKYILRGRRSLTSQSGSARDRLPLNSEIISKSPLPIRLRVSTLLATFLILSSLIFFASPPRGYEPLNESDLAVALWAKENLNTFHVNYIGTKSLTAHWLTRMWGEHLPDDLLIDLPTLGPKTFADWRNDDDWGEYLLVTSNQHFPIDPALRAVFQRGDSAIFQKSTANMSQAKLNQRGRFGDALALVDYSLPRQTINAGDEISLIAKIETLRVPARQVVWRLQLSNLKGDAVAEIRRDPLGNKFPFHRWREGVMRSQSFSMRAPADVSPGVYDLQLGLYQVGDGEPLRYAAADGTQDDVARVGRIKVQLPQVPADELAAITRVDARISDAFTLLGFRTGKISPLRLGDSLQVILYWRSEMRREDDITVFVHLLDATGILRAQRDSAPRDGTYPTLIWQPGEIITDSYVLTVPRDAAPGDYRVAVGMYQWQSLKRLSIADANGRATGDQIILPQTLRVGSAGQ